MRFIGSIDDGSAAGCRGFCHAVVAIVFVGCRVCAIVVGSVHQNTNDILLCGLAEAFGSSSKCWHLVLVLLIFIVVCCLRLLTVATVFFVVARKVRASFKPTTQINGLFSGGATGAQPRHECLEAHNNTNTKQQRHKQQRQPNHATLRRTRLGYPRRYFGCSSPGTITSSFGFRRCCRYRWRQRKLEVRMIHCVGKAEKCLLPMRSRDSDSTIV